jgi:hypothetical protein
MGVWVFDFDWALEQITTQATEEQLGPVIVSPFSAGPAKGLYELLEYLDYNKLTISGVASNSKLTSEANFPKYIRVNTDNQMYARTGVSLMRYYKWKKIAVLHLGISFTTDVYDRFVEFIDETGEFEITNSPEGRKIPPGIGK